MIDMHMQASVEVISKSLYNEDAKRTPALHGALDKRMVFKSCIMSSLLGQNCLELTLLFAGNQFHGN